MRGQGRAQLANPLERDDPNGSVRLLRLLAQTFPHFHSCTPSHCPQLRYLKVTEKSGYQAAKGL